ncbi:MAG: hypothetical protein WC412_04425 [Candidatus Omnitrophota bacterium]|jgi:hypothetical protein
MARPKSKKPEDVRSERVLINVTPETLAKTDELAGKLRMPRSEFLDALIVMGLKDQEFVIKLVSATLIPAKDLINALKKKIHKQ